MNISEVEKVEMAVFDLISRSDRIEVESLGTCVRCRFKDDTQARFTDLEQAEAFVKKYESPEEITLDIELTESGWVVSAYDVQGILIKKTSDFVTREKAYDSMIGLINLELVIHKKEYHLVNEFNVLNKKCPPETMKLYQ